MIKNKYITRKDICDIFTISEKTAQNILNKFYIENGYKKIDEKKYITKIKTKEFFKFIYKNIKK